MRWSFGLLTFVLFLADVRAQNVPSNSPPTVTTATGVNTGYIYENSHLGQNVLDRTTSLAKPLQLIVTDPDDSISGQKTTFSFSATGTVVFNVDSNGYIYLASGNLDYETTKSGTINVRVTETNTAEKRFTDVTVTILVLDLNDNDPVFTSTGAVHVSVPEGDYTLSSRLLAQVDATDADFGANGLLKYSIMSVEPAVLSVYFTINANSGDVSLSGRVTYPSDYVVIVKASDSAVPPDAIRSATKNLYVNVTSAGNNAPQIPSTLYTITISEGTVTGTCIFTVPATDPDGQVLSFTITAGNAAGKFSIDSSGQLRTIGSLDREVTPTYGLTVTVTDTSTPLPLSATTTVSVILTDVNDNNPFFPSQYQFTVPENQPTGTSVGTVTATDADQPNNVNSELTYRLNLANSFFAINPTTGQITTLQPLDYEFQSQHIFEVLAVDRASDSRTGTVSVTVLVTDVQDSVPLFTQQIFTANVAEGSANTFVVFVSAVDADTVDNIQYKFLSPATAATFSINSVSGLINTAVALDYETQRYYEFFVTTADGQGSTNPSSTATVRVTVLDQNDNIPVLLPSAPSVQVFEDAEINRVLVIALATDADAANTSNSEIRFSIVSVTPSSGSSFFSIDRDNGQLVIEKSFTNDPGVNQYQIIVRASDRGTPVQSSQAMFTVTVLRNTAPLLVSSSILVNINHTIEPRTFVTSIQAVDPDPGDYGRLNYQLLGDSIASRYFQLVLTGNGVNITTIDQLIKDTARTYYLTITAKDNAGIVSKTATAIVTVNVNRNLQDPRWLNLQANLQTTISITENDPLGQAVFTLSAEDLDILPPDNEVEYHLTGNDPAMNYFKIDSSSGIISLIKLPVQNRTISQFTVSVNLTDKGVPPRTTGIATLFVNVLRNEQPPVYINTSYYVQLREGVPLGTSVVQVSATDNDTNSNFNQITYRLIGDDTAPNFFTVVGSGSLAGRIITSGNLATDSTDTFRIRIEATDNGVFQRKATAFVYVKVLRNLNRPQWPFNQLLAVVLIPETQNVDSVIYTLPLVTDSDSTSPDNITNYRLTGSTPIQGQNYYQVNATSGEVVIKQDLTRDHNITLYRLTFQAYDLGTPSLTGTQTFTLTVNVYRNTRPVFNPSIYSVSVDETRTVNTNILPLFANDIDTINYPGGLFGQLSYRIASPASAMPYFMVVVDNGQVVLRVASSLVNAPLDRYLLLVQVTDGGGLSDYAEITIDIRRNLNAPQFTQSSYVVNITEDLSVGSDINITVLARDADLRDEVTYQLIKDNKGAASLNFFYIERNTGNIFLRRPLTGVNTTEFEFTVRAIDSGRPPGEADVNVTIRVIHLPVPVFVQPFSTTIREDVATNTSVITVNAEIQRTTSSGQIVYEAIGQLPAIYYFSIDRFTGVVIVQRDLRRDRSQSYMLTVKAYDTSAPTKFSTQDIFIMVRRNVNSPQFDRDTYLISVGDDDPMGRLVISLNATDKDPDVLVYNLTGDQRCQQVFYLTSSTSGVGNLYLGTNLLSTTDASFNCTVTVTDNGYPISNSGRAQVLITVARRQPPVFVMTSYSVETNETASVNTTVVRVQASSTPILGRIAYRTEGIYPADTFFLVDNFTGEVQIKQDLRADSLRLTIYTLRVVAYDTAKPLVTGTTLVYITVRRNLNSPVIRPPTITSTVREDTDITFWGYRVNVTDPDSIQVLVSDDGMPPNTVTGEIIINVPRDRFNPGFTNLPDTKTIEETVAVGSVVYNIGASDGDQIGKLVYQLDGYLPAETFFAINSTTGVITIRNSPNSDVLERGSYTLHVCVYDDAWPSNHICSNLTVVINRNPNGPQFSQRSYGRTIRGNFPPGDIVIQMTAQDLDGDKVKFTSEASEPIQNIFYVNPDSDSVMLIESLMNITTIQVYQFNVSVTDGRHTNPKTDRVTVTISVTPLQGPPVFSNSSVEITIPLTQSNGSIVYTLFAQDPDQQGFIQYRLIGFPLGQEYFAVNPNTGVVTLRKALTLNPDKFPSYILLIEAYDSVEPEDKNYMTVIILVNRNLHAPEFSPTSSYTASVTDYDPIGTSVHKVSAQDQDITEPENNVIYRIDVGRAGGNEYFSLDSNTGLITINNQLYKDTAKPTQYTLYVLATDPSYNPKTATATVFVTVERNVPPTFNPNTYSISVSEATPLFNPIITVFATDANPMNSLNGQLVFSISDTSARNVWQIDEQNGTLSPRVGLRDIVQEIWGFTVQVNDKGIPSLFDSASVRLTITRIGKPTFLNTEYFLNKDENTPVNTTIIQMQANDPQPLSNLVYEIRGDGLAQTYFEINSTTGVIRTSKNFTDDNNKSPSYTVRVFAYRQSNPLDYAQALVHVTVIRNPSAPTFLHGDLTFRIPESQQLSVGFGKVNATDPDVGTNGEITYSISAIDPTYASSYFFVNPNTGSLSVIGNLMEDPTTPQYLLTVVAKDNGAPNRKQVQVRVTVIVTRNPNPPIFQKSLYTVSINENVPAGSDVVQVIATDKDNGRIAYRTEGIYPADTFFLVDNFTGEVQIKQDLRADSLRLTIYTLRVVAYDTAKPLVTGTALVYITVRRNLNSPVIRPPTITLTVREDTDITFWGYRVNVTDPDSRNLTCSIIGNAKAQEFFRIEPDSCLIKMKNNLLTDPDKTTEYRIQVQVLDDGMPPNTVTGEVIITVPRDRFNPGFTNLPDTKTIDETVAVSSVVYNIEASDGDQKGKLVYQLDGYLPAETFFAINSTTGVITVHNSPNSDVLERGSYTLRLCVYDDAWPSNRICSNLTVVINRNPNGPQFSQRSYDINIHTNFPPGGIVVQMTAHDFDGDNVKFTSEASASIQNIFYVNPDSGSVMLIGSLMNITTIQVYQFNVSVTDGRRTNPKTDRVTVTISVAPLQGPPVFSNSSVEITIPLTQSSGSIVYTLLAQDPDQQGFVQYRLIGFPLGQEYFAVNPNTGAVTLRKPLTLNPDKFPSYVLFIESYDSALPDDKSYMTLIIHVNRNLYAPEFRPTSSYTASVKDYDPVGTSVIQVSAQDLDITEPENNVVYRIDVGRAGGNEYFRINSNTGLITINNQLYKDSAKPTQYTLYVLATDPSYNPKTATATVFVTVERNVAPTFNLNTYSMSVSEATPLFNPISTVFATDANPMKSVSFVPVTETVGNSTFELPEEGNNSVVDINITSAGEFYNGRSVNITCITTVAGNATPTFTWKFNGTVMNPVTGSRINISNNTVDRNTPQRISKTVSFNPIKSSDSGTYECVVTVDNLPPSVMNRTVFVLSQPVVLIHPVTQTVDAGSTVNITCQVEHDVQITQMVWYRNGTRINSTNQLSEETFIKGTTPNTLIHRHISYTTIYECEGENAAGPGNMRQANIYVVLPGSQPGETCKTENDTRGTEWSRTLQGTYNKKSCPTGMSGEAVRYCSQGGVWRDASYDNCIKRTLQDLERLTDNIKNGLAPNIVPDSLVNLTSLTNPNTVKLQKAEVQVVSSILDNVIQISNSTKNITNSDVENFLEIASNVIDVKNSPSWQALINEGKAGASMILQNVEEYCRIKAKSINSGDEPVKRFTKKNLFVEIGYKPVSDIQFPNTTANGSVYDKDSSSGFILSRDALNNGNYTSYSGAYFNNVTGIIQRYVHHNGSKTNTGADLEINSVVLSLQLDPPPRLLSPPLILKFKHFSANYSDPVCSFWMFIADGRGNGTWSSKGCKLVSTSDYTTVCECDHLTNFAILMSPGKMPAKDQVPLSIISIIGCAISIFCLSVTMIAHFIVWRYVKSDRTILLMNLCLALIISYVIFLAGVDKTENKGACIAVAALLHYFYLAVFFLLFAFGIELTVSVTYVFVTRSRMQWLLPLAWFLPAVVVAISLGVTKLEGYGNEKFCWLSIEDGLIWAFVGPAALVILLNFIILIVVFQRMFSSSAMKTKSNEVKAKTAARSLCVLLPITGITWVFGILSVNEDLVVFQYLFAIINSLQGLFISLFHCFFNHNLRRAIKQINAARKRSQVPDSTTPKSTSYSSGHIPEPNRNFYNLSKLAKRHNHSQETQQT